MIEHNFLDPYQIHVCHNTGTLPWAQYDGLESVHLNYSSSKLNILTTSLTKTDSEKCKNITSDLRSDPIKTPTMHLHHMFAYLYNTLTFYTSPGTRQLHLIIQLSLWLQYCLYIQSLHELQTPVVSNIYQLTWHYEQQLVCLILHYTLGNLQLICSS